MTDPNVESTSAADVIDAGSLDNRARYQLLTSLVVPRPIGWISSNSSDGIANLAPFSYFVALSATPMLVGVSIGSRRGSPKDTITNIRHSGEFCVNVVTERHLEAMNESAGEHPPDVDEFAVAGVEAVRGHFVSAPYVGGCPAVMECRLFREVELGDATNVLVIGEVLGIRVANDIPFTPGTHLVDPDALRPVARLGGDFYSFLGQISTLPRAK